jgi:hypothetical protein
VRSWKSKAAIAATAVAIEEQATAAIAEQATIAVEEQATTAIEEQARMTTADSSALLGTSEAHADFGMEVDSTVMKSVEDAPNSNAASNQHSPVNYPSPPTVISVTIDVINVDSFILPQSANISLKPSDNNVIYDLATLTKVKTDIVYDYDFGFTSPLTINTPLKPSYDDEIIDLSTPKKDRKDKKNRGKENIPVKVGSIPRTPATAKLSTSISSSMKRQSPDDGDMDSGRKTKCIRLSESSEFNSMKTMFVDDKIKREQFNGELLGQFPVCTAG